MSLNLFILCQLILIGYVFCKMCDGDENNKNKTPTKTQAESYMTRQAVINEVLCRNLSNGQKYDSTIAPNFEEDCATDVFVQIFLQNIYSVSESSMDFSVDLVLKQRWTDARLQYNNMSNLNFIEFDHKLMNSVWVPDTYFANEKKANVHEVTEPNKMMHLYRNGTVLYSMRLSLTLSCPMNLRKYPMDEQKCPIVMQSYAYTAFNINYTWEVGDFVHIQHRVIMSQFEPREGDQINCRYDTNIVHTAKGLAAGRTLNLLTQQQIAGDFSCLQTEIYLKRKVGYYIIQVFVPSILIVVLSWVGFWIDHDAVPARISLGVLTVLTMTTQSSGSRQSLPQVSYVKAIDVWMFTCLLFVFAALVECSYVNVIDRRERKKHKVASMETVDINLTAKKTTVTQPENGALLAEVSLRTPLFSEAKHIDKLSRRIFPILFFLFNSVFWTYYYLTPDPDPE